MHVVHLMVTIILPPAHSPQMNATGNQTVVASFISFLRQQKISEEHAEGIESNAIKFYSHMLIMSLFL